MRFYFRISFSFLCILFCIGKTTAQIFPAEGDSLNFTEVMFEYDSAPVGVKYRVQVIEHTGKEDFNHPFIEQTDSATATLIGGLTFGEKYIWRFGAVQQKGNIIWSAPIHFEIRSIPASQFGQTRLRILENKNGDKNRGLILIDQLKAAFDFSGTPVWFLSPEPHAAVPAMANDLRLNQLGRISFLLRGERDEECDLNGNVLWSYPNASVTNQQILSRSYHHDFRHLPNGNYMMMTNDKRWVKIPSYVDIKSMLKDGGQLADSVKVFTLKGGVKVRNSGENLYEAEIEYGSLVEMDSNYDVVWYWDSEKHLNKNGIFNSRNNGNGSWIESDAHLNAFCIDDSDKFVYASFRNLSRVIRIDKADGEVVRSWGDSAGGDAKHGKSFFHLQHAITLTPDKNLAVFDNEDTAGTKNSAVVVFSNPKGSDSSRIIWHYECNFDSGSNTSDRGGNVDFLPNGDMLVCMGGVPRIFELTPDKQIVWSALLEKENLRANMVMQLYRAHYASSLYPCYFSMSLNKQFLNNKDKTFLVKIFNKGSEDDSYHIEIICGNQEKQALNTSSIKAGQSGSFEIPCFRNAAEGNAAIIKISSKTNPDFTRTKMLPYRK